MRKRNDLVKLKGKLQSLASQVAREEFGVDLDYSVASVKEIEAILGKLHDYYAASRDDEGLHGLALEFAAYLIGVIERNFGGGTWRRDHPQFGPDSFPYEFQGSQLFPYGWCLKRIVDGSQDDVWSKFQTLVIAKSEQGAV